MSSLPASGSAKCVFCAIAPSAIDRTTRSPTAPAAGILVLSAREGGPAWRAGLKGSSRDEYGRLVLGDIITAVNGVKIKTSSDLYRVLDKSAVRACVCNVCVCVSVCVCVCLYVSVSVCVCVCVDFIKKGVWVCWVWAGRVCQCPLAARGIGGDEAVCAIASGWTEVCSTSWRILTLAASDGLSLPTCVWHSGGRHPADPGAAREHHL